MFTIQTITFIRLEKCLKTTQGYRLDIHFVIAFDFTFPKFLRNHATELKKAGFFRRLLSIQQINQEGEILLTPTCNT